MTAFHVPELWTFENADVAAHFDRHVREQLPWYDLVTGAIAHIARHYITRHSRVYDIGASTGNITRALSPAVREREASIFAIESSKDMAAKFDGDASLIIRPAEQITFKPFSVAVLNLTLQFIDLPQRAALLAHLKAQVQPGGAIILVDKFEPPAGYISTVLYRLTLAGKVANNAAPAEILAKELSLGGVQRPLRHEDFADWQPFFRFGDFAGYIYSG